MNCWDFGLSCILALVALGACFLPRRLYFIRWGSIALGVISVYIVYYLSRPSFNSHLPFPLWEMVCPILISLLAIAWSAKILIRR